MLRTHLAFSFLAALVLIHYFNIKSQLAFAVFLLFFSAIPDIDNYKSQIGKKIKPISFIIQFIFGHRGIFHSIFITLIFALVFFILKLRILILAALIGYLSHLLLDMLTPSGIRLFYPFSKRKIRGIIKTNSLEETVFFILIVIADVYFLIIT